MYGTAIAAALGLALQARADDGMRADKPMPMDKPAAAGKLAGPAAKGSGGAINGQVGEAVMEGDLRAQQNKVVTKLHASNLKEIQMGGLAQKSGGAVVQRYGEMLVSDHKKADVDVLNYATKMGVSMATPGNPVAGKDDPELAEHVKMGDLKAMKGQAFDKQFMTMMVADHKQDLADVKAARAKVPAGDDLAALLDSMVPTLQKHLDSAQMSLTRMGPQARRPE